MITSILKSIKKILEKQKELQILHWIIIGFFGLMFVSISMANHYFFRTYGYDYAVYNNAFYDLAHFRFNYTPMLDPAGKNFFGIHLAFPLVVFIPLYWLFSWLLGTYTLLLIQVAIILIGGYFVYKLILKKSNNYFLAIFALIYYFVLLGRYTAFTADYIDTTIGASIIPVFFYFFEAKKFKQAFVAFLFIIFSKENMSLWFVFISIVLIIKYFNQKENRKFSLLLLGFSIIYFIVVMTYIMPYINSSVGHDYTGFSFKILGSNIPEALKFIFSHPIETFKLLYTSHVSDPAYADVKMEFYMVYFISGGFLVFYRPIYLIMFIPIIGQKMFNDEPIRWSIQWFYCIEVVSLLPIVVFTIICENVKNFKLLIAILICALTLKTTLAKMNNRTMNWWGFSKEYIFDDYMFKSNMDVVSMHKALKLIPSNCPVSSSSTVASHLAYRRNIYCFPAIRDANYIVIHKYESYPIEKTDIEKYINLVKNNSNWVIIYEKDPLIIFQKINQIGSFQDL